jgi:hypothetical protein
MALWTLTSATPRIRHESSGFLQRIEQALPGFPPAGDPCEVTAQILASGSLHGLQDDLAILLGSCLNVTDEDEAAECLEDAAEAFREGLAEIEEQKEARSEVCRLLGGGPYDPEIDPESFARGKENPFFPLVPGTTWIYHNDTKDRLEVIEVTVTEDTKEILGVECRVVRDTVTVDGEIEEDTLDYFAEDEDGNVWYFGEISLNFEDGELTDIEGSWQAGEDGGKAGIVMLAHPAPGNAYRQEFLLGEAEDVGLVLATDVSVKVPYGAFEGCLQTADFTPLEPGELEHKFYAPGVGLVLEVEPDRKERTELVLFSTPR